MEILLLFPFRRGLSQARLSALALVETNNHAAEARVIPKKLANHTNVLDVACDNC